jgi:tuberous sclerosis 2
LKEEDITGVLQFLGDMVERAALLSSDAFGSPTIVTDIQSPQSPAKAPHRRHHSSSTIPLLSSNGSALSPSIRRPVDVAVNVYLDHLTAQMRYLSPTHLKTMLPVLFRALACYASSLPRLSLSDDGFDSGNVLEARILDILDKLLNGTYASTCYVIMKYHMMPHPEADIRAAIQASTGACRALRIYWRKALCARLARAVIAKSGADIYAPTGAPSGIDLDTALLERAWAKDEVTRGDLSKVGRLFRRASEAWGDLAQDKNLEGSLSGSEEVLLEIAGAIRDVFQEYDARGEFEDVDEEESSVVGGILSALTMSIKTFK